MAIHVVGKANVYAIGLHLVQRGTKHIVDHLVRVLPVEVGPVIVELLGHPDVRIEAEVVVQIVRRRGVLNPKPAPMSSK